MKEIIFNQIYIKKETNTLENKNMFQRRILGLVSYYYGSSSDLFAKKKYLLKN